jgi:hypothetical protein
MHIAVLQTKQGDLEALAIVLIGSLTRKLWLKI